MKSISLRTTSILLLLLGTLCLQCAEPRVLKPIASYQLPIPEPSDICIHPNGSTLLIVSDRGYLYHTDTMGVAIKTSPLIGGDIEGVWAQNGNIYVVDEAEGLVHSINPESLKVQRTVSVPYSGKRNSGFESIANNQNLGVHILITEKEPILIFELDSNFGVIRSMPFSATADISAATWHNNHLWLLSDEDRMVLKLNPKTYKVLKSWHIPDVAKPEGIAFLSPNTMLAVCDRESKLYYFHLHE